MTARTGHIEDQRQEEHHVLVSPPTRNRRRDPAPQPHSVHVATERGVILHAALKWFVAYFPGDPQRLADPSDPGSIRVVGAADVADAIVAYRDLPDCDPAWVLGTWKQLREAGPGELQAPQVIGVWLGVARFFASAHRVGPAGIPATAPVPGPSDHGSSP